MEVVMNEVMTAAGSDMAVFVKMNMRDGFKGGMETDETLQVAKRLLALGAHALVLSGGFVSKAPMYVMRVLPTIQKSIRIDPAFMINTLGNRISRRRRT